ncbi:hypothetical protein [Caulobacter sp. NIBR2454]|nr:hypothetical protein [Caulobacter sp. NIBR2454]
MNLPLAIIIMLGFAALIAWPSLEPHVRRWLRNQRRSRRARLERIEDL